MIKLILVNILFYFNISFAQDVVCPRTIKIEHGGSQDHIYYTAVFYDDIIARQKIGKEICPGIYVRGIDCRIYVGKQQFDQIALLTYFLIPPSTKPMSYYYVSYKLGGKEVIGRIVTEGRAIRSFCKNILSIMKQDTENKEDTKFFAELGF
jgi:hypothetical protein